MNESPHLNKRMRPLPYSIACYTTWTTTIFVPVIPATENFTVLWEQMTSDHTEGSPDTSCSLGRARLPAMIVVFGLQRSSAHFTTALSGFGAEYQ